ncbi:transmembrane 4 L6 family member 1-like [Mugil cephalus]|uniref:transmembrane 4 L6 family member 1-like n=1 Tax=Mugil cephalus TaxID=48193 RepID=UPI001FB614A2|nr:transmembrane 4 L6 family member 1-like [Mugil cephalus]
MSSCPKKVFLPQTESKQEDSLQLYRMCVSSCLQCVGVSLVPMATVCMLSNLLLLLPEFSIHFLLEGHVTREATWATGLWGSGFLVRSSCPHVPMSSCPHVLMCVQ